MCAIFGIVGEYDETKARSAFATLAHRGPDTSGIVQGEGLFLAHHRLAIIDPHPEADQPMTVDGATILSNGEIYNYRALRDELNACETDSDTEVALRAFKRWGPSFVQKVRGMYAIAIWDRDRLHLFRDPFGKKPLYYAHHKGLFIFASEIKAIVAYLGGDPIAKSRLDTYLAFQGYVAPETLYPSIRQLEAGEYLRYAKGRIVRRVDDIAATPTTCQKISSRDIERDLERSVALRLVADAPIGALLSGGLDSSLVAALAQKRLDHPLPTFTIGYESYEKYDERPYARIVAKHIGSDHHETVMKREEFFEVAKALARHLDEPIGDPAAIPLWFLSRQIAASGIKAILTGDGADELFFGYRLYPEMAAIERNVVALPYRGWLSRYFHSHYAPNREWEWYKRALDGTPLYRSGAELFTDLQRNRIFRFNVADDASLDAIAHLVRRFGTPHGLSWYAYIDLKIKLEALYLKKLDRVTMAHGIEARSPFLDKELARAILSTDPHWRLGDATKWLLKKVAARYLPSSILARKKKGFSYPWVEWLHESGEIRRLFDFNRKTGLFREEPLRFIVEKSRKGRFGHHLYALWFLALWMERRV